MAYILCYQAGSDIELINAYENYPDAYADVYAYAFDTNDVLGKFEYAFYNMHNCNNIELFIANSDHAEINDEYDINPANLHRLSSCKIFSTIDSYWLQKYTMVSPEDWQTLVPTSPIHSNPSVYFDMDGVLATWYHGFKGFNDEKNHRLSIFNPTNHYFANLEPYENMVELAKRLQNASIDVCIITSADRNTIRDKWYWCKQYIPFIPESNIFFAPIGSKKADYIKSNADISVLIDDFQPNLEAWTGVAIKALNGINSHQFKFPEIDFANKTDISGYTDNVVRCIKQIVNAKIPMLT